MARYVYGCSKNKGHERTEVVHSMGEDPTILCDECGAEMRRVPQAFQWYMNPGMVLLDQMDQEFGEWKRNHR